MNQNKGVIQSIYQRSISERVCLSFAYKEEPNLKKRESMEDYTIKEPDLLLNGEYAFYAVLDGHGGHEVAEYISVNFVNILKSNIKNFKSTDDLETIIDMSLIEIETQLELLGMAETGSTFCSVLIDCESKEMIVVNIGDSKILQVACENDNILSAGFLSTAHKTTDFSEVRRIAMNGGMVFNGRVGGKLMLTRSIGDFGLRKYGVISDPEIHRYSLDTSSLLVLGSDGLWDFINAEDVLSILVSMEDITCDTLCSILTKEAIKKGSCDNISIICVIVN